jgi:hypothetical protein
LNRRLDCGAALYDLQQADARFAPSVTGNAARRGDKQDAAFTAGEDRTSDGVEVHGISPLRFFNRLDNYGDWSAGFRLTHYRVLLLFRAIIDNDISRLGRRRGLR